MTKRKDFVASTEQVRVSGGKVASPASALIPAGTSCHTRLPQAGLEGLRRANNTTSRLPHDSPSDWPPDWKLLWEFSRLAVCHHSLHQRLQSSVKPSFSQVNKSPKQASETIHPQLSRPLAAHCTPTASLCILWF